MSEEEGLSNTPIGYRIREGVLLLTLAVAVFLLVSLLSYHRSDPGWSHYAAVKHIQNSAGRVGAWIADFFLYIFGYLAYLFPLLLIYCGWHSFRNRHYSWSFDLPATLMVTLRSIGFLCVLISGAGLASLFLRLPWLQLPYHAGGILGNVVGWRLINTFNVVGTGLILSSLLIVGFTLFTGISWFRIIELLGAFVLNLSAWSRRAFEAIPWHKFSLLSEKIRDYFQKRSERPEINKAPPSESASTITRIKKLIKKDKPPEKLEEQSLERDIKRAIRRKAPRYSHSKILPDLSLLDRQSKDDQVTVNKAELEARSKEVESHLGDFGVNVKVVAVYPGPVVTRYELELAAGTKVSKITNLAKDLARSLSVTSVRVVEVIPGKSVIGLELPNEHREMVNLRDVLASKVFQQARSALTLALGKDISGHPVTADLAKMPHLLVAGTTGSGKSVSLNAMLLSLLYKSTPEQLRLILIDPKMLELAVYDGIPHLLTPVVTDMKEASSALRWSVVEMERRYRLMASLGVRNIAGYNAKVRQAREKGKPLHDPLSGVDADGEPIELDELPQIVILADEFADMMVVVGKKVETLIARLAQKARAAGVHLILATQRPSVDVITGLIKANIPSRIAFQVSQKVDSRTILDQSGADQLLGHGDMLYLPPGTGIPMRVHGAFVSDEEVHRVVDALKEKGDPDYIDEILNESSGADQSGYTDAVMGDAEKDSLYDEAVEFVVSARRVSISSVQRRFKIGYNRAARIVEAMEEAGVVSKMDQGGAREVLVPNRNKEN